MSFLSFFKKNKKSGSDSTVSSEELLNEVDQKQEKNEVYTELSTHPSMTISQEQQYVLRFLNNSLEPLKQNQISLAGIELNREDSGIVVSAFVRNSLPKPITFGDTDLILTGPNDEKFARKTFDLSELGELPAESSRPWNFVFENSTLLTGDIPSEGWKLAFEIKPKHQLQLDETWEQNLTLEMKTYLVEMLEKLPPLQPEEVNLLGLEAKLTENNDLRVTLLIRNGSNKNINIEQLPLKIIDASGDTVAMGGFKLENFEVKANSSRPWNFIFPNNLLAKQSETIDLSRWTAAIMQSETNVSHQ